jgi:2-polyprenyl-3-methyl-5-hydroxy-6-metoxy-1,4-benzoquinol methylase
MARFNVQQCPVCGNERFSPFMTCIDHFVSGESFPIKECNSCNFKITKNAADEKTSGRYYQSEEYISHSNTSKGVVNALYHQVRKYMLQRKRRLVEKACRTTKGHILDIGAGTGYFLNEMKRHGWQVSGTEKSLGAREMARSEFGLSFFPAEKLPQFKKESFDAITLWHVLEHIHLLNETLNTVNKLLKNSGILVIALPNHTAYDARHYKAFWAAWDVPRHLWHFAPEHIKKLGEKHGFRLTRFHSMPFDAFYVSILSEKYKKAHFPLLKGLFFGEISWLNSLLKTKKCSSIIYVFEKSPTK